MDLFLSIYIFILGLIFGSFFNVCIIRPFANETISKPKTSKCMSCGHPLAWYDNIPLFSYLLLMGKCRYCKTHISWQYPFVEFITAVLFLCAYLKFGLTWQLLGALVVLSYFIIMSGTDFKGQVIFDMHTIPFIIICVICGLCQGNYFDTALGAFIGSFSLELYARSGYLFCGQRIQGEGDTYIAAGIGALLGAKGIVITIILAVLIQSLWALPALIIKYLRNKKYSEILTMVVFIFIVGSFCFIDRLGGFDSSFWIYITYVLLMISYAYKVCTELINSTKLEGGGTPLPFGPALFLGATVMIFFGEQIISLLKNIEWLQNVL